MTPGRWVALVVVLLAGVFAFQGGIFTTASYRQLERERDSVTVELTRIRREVDSMRALRDSLASDPAVQERTAREQWGMIRDGELSFRIKVQERPDSAR